MTEEELYQMITELRQKIIAIDERLKNIEGLFQTKPITVPVKKESLREFLDKLNPKTDIDKVLLIGYYKEVIQELGSFSRLEVAKGYQEAREKLPTNITDLLSKNVAKAFIMPIDKGEGKVQMFALTNTGIKHIKERLNPTP